LNAARRPKQRDQYNWIAQATAQIFTCFEIQTHRATTTFAPPTLFDLGDWKQKRANKRRSAVSGPNAR